MNRLHAFAGLMLAAGICAATAAPLVPSSVLPGRERDRFTESPVERFMQPGPYQAPQLITPTTEPRCRDQKPGRSKSRPAKRKDCG